MLDDEKCLCGSGRLYSMCCKPFSGQGIENYKKEIDSKNYIKAYYVAVAMLSDYLEDVRKHTNRILKDNPVIGRFVLHKDVNALSELADRIFHCIPDSTFSDPSYQKIQNLLSDCTPQEMEWILKSVQLIKDCLRDTK